MMILLKTKRLIICEHDFNDSTSMHKLYTDPEAMRYLPGMKSNSIEETEKKLSEAINEILLENRTKYFFKILLLDKNEYVGEIGYTVKSFSTMGKVVDLGYFILPKFWGKGLVTEAALEVVKFAFEQDNVIKIVSSCNKKNRASERVMIKLGMTKETECNLHNIRNKKSEDREEYQLTKDEWKKNIAIIK